MRGSLLHSLLDLAHATSQNLGFAHRDDVHVSYGEETITETNLLELRRRHPSIITLKTFGKKKEAKNGADWEWHIIGRHRKFGMRVQAKRLQKDDKLKISHKVKSSGEEQIRLLIKDAKAHQLKPVYCFYSSEKQRGYWKKKETTEAYEAYEAGCLLAPAEIVEAKKMPTTLSEIEKACVPWHYLVARQNYMQSRTPSVLEERLGVYFSTGLYVPFLPAEGSERSVESASAQGFPTLDELNDQDRPSRELIGLVEFGDQEFDRQKSEAEYRERGIRLIMEINVSELGGTERLDDLS